MIEDLNLQAESAEYTIVTKKLKKLLGIDDEHFIKDISLVDSYIVANSQSLFVKITIGKLYRQ